MFSGHEGDGVGVGGVEGRRGQDREKRERRGGERRGEEKEKCRLCCKDHPDGFVLLWGDYL